MNEKNHLTEGPVVQKLIVLTIPMIFAMLSTVVFNLVDTFYVSRLGTQELAAIGFTFPVVMSITSIALGLGVATSSVVSRAIGRNDFHKVKRLATDSLIISLFIVIIFIVLGLTSMDWVFRLLGAQGLILDFIKEYMRIWFWGVAFVVIPMVGNNAIRACGNMVFPSLIMIVSATINLVLDPFLIFGLLGAPRMGLKGAALATVIARAVSLIFSLLVLHFKEKLIDFTIPALKEVMASVKEIIYIGIPAAASRLIVPASMAVIMRLVAVFGPSAVAAFGVALKIEMFVFTLIMALSTALIPFVGQNWGAGNLDRVKKAVRKSNGFSIVWGLICFVLFVVLAVPLGHLFSKDLVVAKKIMLYLWILPVSYGLRGCAFLVPSVFNALNKPFTAVGLNFIRMFVLYIPFALIGAKTAGFIGLLVGLCLANLSAGIISVFVGQNFLKKTEMS